MSYSFVKNSANDQTPQETQLIMTYELARLMDCMQTPYVGYVEHAKTETADFMSMCRMLCEQETWDFEYMYDKAFDSLRGDFTEAVLIDKMYIAMGKMIRGLMYINRFGEPRGDLPVQSMQIVINWLRCFCKYMTWDFWMIYELGERRFVERMRDLAKTGVESRLKPQYRRHQIVPGIDVIQADIDHYINDIGI